MSREKDTYSEKDVNEFIRSFCADAKPKTASISSKSKKPGAAEKPDFDVDSINLNILGGEDEKPIRKDKSALNVAEVTKATDVVEVTDTVEVTKITSKVAASESKESQQDKSSASTAKPSRISAKMRRATRSEFCAAYTGKVDTKKGKPIAITASNMKRLYRLCNLSGVHNACPTYIINNLLSEFLDAVEPESKRWGMLD